MGGVAVWCRVYEYGRGGVASRVEGGGVGVVAGSRSARGSTARGCSTGRAGARWIANSPPRGMEEVGGETGPDEGRPGLRRVIGDATTIGGTRPAGAPAHTVRVFRGHLAEYGVAVRRAGRALRSWPPVLGDEDRGLPPSVVAGAAAPRADRGARWGRSTDSTARSGAAHRDRFRIG